MPPPSTGEVILPSATSAFGNLTPCYEVTNCNEMGETLLVGTCEEINRNVKGRRLRHMSEIAPGACVEMIIHSLKWKTPDGESIGTPPLPTHAFRHGLRYFGATKGIPPSVDYAGDETNNYEHRLPFPSLSPPSPSGARAAPHFHCQRVVFYYEGFPDFVSSPVGRERFEVHESWLHHVHTVPRVSLARTPHEVKLEALRERVTVRAHPAGYCNLLCALHVAGVTFGRGGKTPPGAASRVRVETPELLTEIHVEHPDEGAVVLKRPCDLLAAWGLSQEQSARAEALCSTLRRACARQGTAGCLKLLESPTAMCGRAVAKARDAAESHEEKQLLSDAFEYFRDSVAADDTRRRRILLLLSLVCDNGFFSLNSHAKLAATWKFLERLKRNCKLFHLGREIHGIYPHIGYQRCYPRITESRVPLPSPIFKYQEGVLQHLPQSLPSIGKEAHQLESEDFLVVRALSEEDRRNHLFTCSMAEIIAYNEGDPSPFREVHELIGHRMIRGMHSNALNTCLMINYEEFSRQDPARPSANKYLAWIGPKQILPLPFSLETDAVFHMYSCNVVVYVSKSRNLIQGFSYEGKEGMAFTPGTSPGSDPSYLCPKLVKPQTEFESGAWQEKLVLRTREGFRFRNWAGNNCTKEFGALSVKAGPGERPSRRYDDDVEVMYTRCGPCGEFESFSSVRVRQALSDSSYRDVVNIWEEIIIWNYSVYIVQFENTVFKLWHLWDFKAQVRRAVTVRVDTVAAFRVDGEGNVLFFRQHRTLGSALLCLSLAECEYSSGLRCVTVFDQSLHKDPFTFSTFIQPWGLATVTDRGVCRRCRCERCLSVGVITVESRDDDEKSHFVRFQHARSF